MADDKLRIELDANNLTWGDMRFLLALESKGQATSREELSRLIDMFDRFVIGGAEAVPLARTGEAIAGINRAVGALANSKNSSSNSTPTSGRVKKRRPST